MVNFLKTITQDTLKMTLNFLLYLLKPSEQNIEENTRKLGYILHSLNLMRKLLASNQQTTEPVYGFELFESTRRHEKTNKKTENGSLS